MSPPRVVALSGGVGGAKLALGLDRVLPPGALMVVANIGDDFEHLGLHVSPDLDTLLYALAGLDNPETGWGRRDETWSFMAALEALGGETWFRLGDRDLAIHVERTRRLRRDERLSSVIDDFRRRLGIASRILPVSDDPVRTRVRTASGWLEFQDYFVRQRAEPVIVALGYDGADAARTHPDILAALGDSALEAVVICPSNPFVSIEPILAVPGLRQALAVTRAPVVAVSPIIAGQAVKGPAAKMMRELGLKAEPGAVAARYGDLIDVFIVDHRDRAAAETIPVRTVVTETLMLSLEDRVALARAALAAAEGCKR